MGLGKGEKMSRLIDAEELIKEIQRHNKGCENKLFGHTANDIVKLIDATPTVDRWHCPSKGELPGKDWTKHPKNISESCFILTKRGIGTIARWDADYKTWFENQPHLPVTEVIAWQYFVPPKEEV